MPGTIRISVLDIVDLPSSSAPPSTSIRVIMGRREHQALENGDFSIPLTTLRENLIVKLLNSDGHEMSHTCVETRLVVEKGIWDEMFNLEGGGKMHLKMQFVLSEEEQSRIRMMRLSALKKKHGELVNDSSKGPQKPAAVGINAATPSSNGHEVSIQGSLSGKEDGPTQSVHALQSLKLQSEAESEATEAKHPSQMLITPNPPDKSQDTSAVSRHKTDASTAEYGSIMVLYKREKQSPPEAAIRRALPGEKASSSASSAAFEISAASAKSSLISDPKVEQDAARNMATPGPRGKTPSNVRKMISAFETSTTQDKSPRIKPPPTKAKPSKDETDVLTSSQQSKEHADERASTTSPIGAVTEPDFSSRDSAPLKSKRITEGLSTLKTQDLEGPERSGDTESVIILGSTPLKETHHVKQPLKPKTLSSSENGEMKLLSYHENAEEYPIEGSKELTFLDDSGSFCVTTAGRKTMHLMEAQIIETSSPQENRNITIPNTLPKQVGFISKSDAELNNRVWDKASPSPSWPRKPESSPSAEAPSGGPFGQVMKIGIMVGFGALVLFTRQSKDR